MEIVDLTEEREALYFVCLEDWSDEMPDAGDHKRRWYGRMKGRGLGVKLALDDEGRVGGMIQYYPCEYSPVDFDNGWFISCVWVHGYKEGRGNFQKKGMGTALLSAAEEDIRSRGADGAAAWGIILPFWMKASWFRKHGYKPVDRVGIASLVWKPFTDMAAPPRWIRERKRPEPTPGSVTVTAFVNGSCPAQNIIAERAKRAAKELGAAYVEIDTFDRAAFLEWGIFDGVFVDGKRIGNGPPPSYEKIRKIIAKRVKKLHI